MSDMHRDTFVFKLMTLFKSDGYTVYNIMLEILADNDGIDKEIVIEKEFLTQNMRLKFNNINRILEKWKELKPEITYINRDTDIVFYTPKLKEIMDNWSRRKDKKTTEQLRSKSVVTTEDTKDLDLDLNKNRNLNKDKSRVPDGMGFNALPPTHHNVILPSITLSTVLSIKDIKERLKALKLLHTPESMREVARIDAELEAKEREEKCKTQ